MEDVVHESIRILIDGQSIRQDDTKQSIGSICMVPDTIRNLSPAGAYTPRIISIGPLHKEDQCVRGMEELKVKYMYRLFWDTVVSTNEDMLKTIRECIKEVLENIIEVRACYAPSFINYDDCMLTEMMFIDGCFILELLYNSEHGTWEGGDPIFRNILVKRAVKNDLLLLENQIPFFILQILFKRNVKCIRSSISLIDLIFRFFEDMNIFNSDITLEEDETVGHHHILGLLQSSYRPRGAGCDGKIPTNRYSAIDIAVAGVRIEQQSEDDSLLAVQFLQSFVPGFGKQFIKASFKIPVLRIENSTTSFMWNLIAYEQCYQCSRQYVTSLAFLMDMLIDTKYDVSMLMTAKVLQHSLGKREDVTNIFSSICNGVDLRGFYYSDEWAKLDAHCNRFWPSKLISLKRIFFSLGRFYTSTTWKTLAVIGAVAIFVLTLIQTIYAVRNA